MSEVEFQLFEQYSKHTERQESLTLVYFRAIL